MSIESEGIDPYVVVITDLKAKRDQIDQAIQALENLRGGPSHSPAQETAATTPTKPNAGEFLGMSIADATKKLLSNRKQAMGNADIARALTDGGLVMSANTEHQNIVGAVLTRRFEKVGDIVKVGRGVWGLKEWYPNRTFKPNPKQNGDLAKSSSPIEPEQPFETTGGDSQA